MGTVAGHDSRQTVGHFEVDERDSTDADDRDGVLPTAVDDRRAYTFQRQAVGGDHNRSCADTGKGDGAVGLADTAHGIGE